MLNDPLIENTILNIFQDKELLKDIQFLIDEGCTDSEIDEELGINNIEKVQNLEVIQCLINNIETDEEIAEKTQIKLNIVRKVLYKLYDSGVASYKRSKDPETQWFAYSWKFENEEVYKIIKNEASIRAEEVKKLIEEEENDMFFVCPYNHCRFNFEESTYYQFNCPECGEKMEFLDNSDYIQILKQKYKYWNDIYQEASKQ